MAADKPASNRNTARKLIVLCDGTGNQIDTEQSNVLRLYRVLSRNARQRVFYDPGIGTLGASEEWVRWKANTERVLGLVTGYGLDGNVCNAYQFLLREYRAGDEVYFFGYSRGAYTVRVLAGFINAIGILRPEQQHLLPYAYTAYKQISEDGQFDTVRQFERILKPHRPAIQFLGLWDTVSSVLVPRRDRFYLPARRQLAYTQRNPSVRTVCHALAVHERRRMFRPYLWLEDQPYWGGPFPPGRGEAAAQKIKQVWFPGVHADVGGGHPDAESGLAKLSLQWMCEQLGDSLSFNQRSYNKIVLGKGEGGVPPDPLAAMHDSMSTAWAALEYLPGSARGRQPRQRRKWLGLYLPAREPREIPDGAEIHASVQQRIDAGIDE